MEKSRVLKTLLITLFLICSLVSIALLFMPFKQVEARVETDLKMRPFFYFNDKNYTGEEGKEKIYYSTITSIVGLEAYYDGEKKEITRSLNSRDISLGIPNIEKTYFTSEVKLNIFNKKYSSDNLQVGYDEKGEKIYLGSDNSKFVTTVGKNDYNPGDNRKIGKGWLISSFRPRTSTGYGRWQEVFQTDNFFGQNKQKMITFETDGEYSLQLFFEMYDPGFIDIPANIYNIVLEYRFEIIRDHVLTNFNGSKEHIAGNDIERNSVTNADFHIVKTPIKYLGTTHDYYQDVSYSLYNLDGGYVRGGVIKNASSMKFTDDGYYAFSYSLGGIFSRDFTITKDTSPISSRLSFGNIYRQDTSSKVSYSEGYFELGWSQQKYGDKFKVTIKKNGEIIEQGRTDSKVMQYRGAGTYTIEIVNMPSSSGQYSKKETYTVFVSEMDMPTMNYNKLNNMNNIMFNRLQSKWLQVENAQYSSANTHEIYRHRFVCFPISEQRKANDFAASIGGKVQIAYYTPNLSGDYFFVNDTNINVKAPITDTLYLYDTFIFGHGDKLVSNGYLESNRGILSHRDGRAYDLKYNTPVKSFINSDGEYTIKEYDVYSNYYEYNAIRDLTAPKVELYNGTGYVNIAHNSSYNVPYFMINSFVDMHDEWAVIKINNEYYLKDEIEGKEFYKTGVYDITAYDRNNNILKFTVNISSRNFDISMYSHDKNINVSDGGKYDLICFRLHFDNDILIKLYDFKLNGIVTEFARLNSNIVDFGRYEIEMFDKYNLDSITFSVSIQPRDINSKIKYNDENIADFLDATDIDIKRFKIITDNTYYTLKINGVDSSFNSDYIFENGTYDIQVQDIYTKQILRAKFEILNLPIDFMLLINDGKKIALEDGQIYDVTRFKILANNVDSANSVIKVNNQIVSDYSSFFTDFGEYYFDITNKYNNERITCTINIENRTPNVTIMYNFDDSVQSQNDFCYDMRRFYLLDIPYYLQVSINGEQYFEGEYISQEGEYIVALIDKYSGLCQNFVIEINPLILLEGGENYSKTFSDILVNFYADFTDIALRINGVLESGYQIKASADSGYSYYDFSDLQGENHIYIRAVNVFNVSDVFEVMIIIDKPQQAIDEVQPSTSELNGNSLNHVEKQKNNGYTLYVVIFSSIAVVLCILFFARKKSNKMQTKISKEKDS